MENGEINRVRDALKAYPKGITIAELSKHLNLSRISTSKYLNMLLAYGQAEMRLFGPAKVFYPSQRIPLSEILNFSTSHLMVMNDDLTIIDVNNALLRFFALEREDLVGQRIDNSPIAGFFDPAIMTQLKGALESQGSTLESHIIMQGKEYILDIKCIPTVFESGDHGVSLLSEDITELTEYRQHLEHLVEERSKELQKTNDQLKRVITNHKKARTELKISEIKYRELVENANSIIVKIDSEGNIVFFNEFAQHFFGYTQSEVLGKSIYDTIVPLTDSSGNELQKILELVRQNPDKYERNINENIKKNGERAWVSWTHKLIRNDEGIVKGVLSIGNDITERKRTEVALRESEEKFRTILDSLQSGVVIIDAHTYRILDVNPKALEMIGELKESVTGMICHCFICPAESGKCPVMDLGQTIDSSERVLLARNGEKIPIFKSVIKTMLGGREILVESFVDITERKRTEDALRKSEEKFRSFVENANDTVFSLSLDGRFTYVSPTWTELMGYDASEVIGKPSAAFVHPDDYPHNREVFRQTISTGEKTSGIEYRLRHKNGTWQWHSQNGSPLRDAEGTIVAYLGTGRDITEHKRVEEALQKSERRFHELADMMPEIVFECDLTGRLTYANKNSLRFFQCTHEDRERGLNLFNHIIPGDHARVIEDMRKRIASGDESHGSEYTAIKRDGTRFPVLVFTTCVMQEGTCTGMRGILIDMSRQKKNERALKTANEKINLLASITRHDIINKISVILSYLTIIQMQPVDPALAEYLDKMESATKAIQSQIEFTRVYQDLGTQEPQWIALDTIMPRSQVPATITLNADVEGVTVFADPMLEKVFSNLLDNSIRHGERVTEIRVSSQKSGGDLVVVWEDNGIGVAADEKERIFERGFGKNTGFGMFLIREILTITDITIAETGEPGNGARFEITVPTGAYRCADVR